MFDNCIYLQLVILVGFLLFLFFRKKKNKTQFLISFFPLAIKNMVWMVPTGAIITLIVDWIYGVRLGIDVVTLWGKPISIYTRGLIEGAFLGVIFSLLQAGKKLGEDW